jgi:hypothetical protein
MNILEYTAGIKTFEKSKLLGLVDSLKVEAASLDENLRNLEANDLALDGVAERWVVTKSLIKQLAGHGFPIKDMNSASRNSLAVITAILPELSKLVMGYKGTVWDGKLLTLKQTNLMNLIEHISFWLRYTRSIYDVLLTLNNKKIEAEKYLSKYDSKWINGTQDLYKSFTLELAKGGRSILKELNEIPELPVDEGPLATYEAIEGPGKIDLLKKGFGIHLVNPVYWYHLSVAKINIARIENMREENMAFSAKIAQAVNLRAGTDDHDLDRRIEIYQDKIVRNNHTIENIEAQYA